MNNLLAANVPVIVDVIAIVFVAVFAIRGISKGFAKLFVSVFGTILSLLFAVLLCASVTNFLQSQFSFVTTVSKSLGGVLDSIFPGVMNVTLEQATTEKLAELGLGDWLSSIILSVAADSSIPTDTTLNEIICPTFAYYVVIVIAVIGLFIVFKILFFLLGVFVKKLHSIKLVAVVDKTLGLVLGCVSGIINLELLILILGIIPIEAVQQVYAAISQTIFANFVQSINLYEIILNAISSANVVGYVKGLL